MHDQILARSFSRNEGKRFGNFAFAICLVTAFSICSVLKPHFHLSVLNLEVLTNASLDIVLVRDASMISRPMSTDSHIDQPESKDNRLPIFQPPSTSSQVAKAKSTTDRSKVSHLPSKSNVVQPQGTTDTSVISGRSIHWKDSHVLDRPIETETEEKIMCSVSETLSDYCEINGKIRIDGNTSTIYIVSSHKSISQGNNFSRTIRPYARKGNEGAMIHVRKWTIKIVLGKENFPSCTKNHTTPAILFSTGGFLGNHFHDFSDLVVPLFSSSRIFNRKVHFLATNYQTWWISKFRVLLNKLSEHDVIDIDREGGVQCYKNVIIGLKSEKELGIDASKSPNGYSMKDFRHFLRTTYALKRETANKLRKGANNHKKPRLMIISRRKTRRLMNEDKIVKMAQSTGYEVIVADATLSTNLSKFAETVNSCDVLMGVHGAGLTNMVFLPNKAVVIQVVPFGEIDWFAYKDFGEPSKDMNLRYLSYKIRAKESSLITQYPVDNVVIRDPMFIHKQGWDAIRSIYLDKQNVRLDVRRFRSTLLKALKLLHH